MEVYVGRLDGTAEIYEVYANHEIAPVLSGTGAKRVSIMVWDTHPYFYQLKRMLEERNGQN